MKTFASLYGGFGGTDIGALAAGLTPVWSIEQDPAIAEVASANLGHRVYVRDILDCDPMDFDAVDVLHASPPCPNFSVANSGKGETDLDIALACKTAAFVTTLKPRVFTLENVYAYRNSHSWQMIERALYGAGYWLHVEHINAADMGVPQTRKRMIVRAIRGGFVPYLPEPRPWVGWYSAVADLIDTLPETQFANWQKARLPKELLYAINQAGSGQVSRNSEEISSTRELHRVWCAECIGCASQGRQSGKQRHNEPGAPMSQLSHEETRRAANMHDLQRAAQGARVLQQALPSFSGIRRSAIHETQAGGAQKETDYHYRCIGCQGENKSLGSFLQSDFPQSENEATGRLMPRAFLMAGGGNTNFDEAYPGRGCRYDDEPAHTVTATSKEGGALPKAWLVDGGNDHGGKGPLIRDDTEPAMTITAAGSKLSTRSLLSSGKVVSMTPRCLARFQTFPDTYELPANARLAAKGIGNAVCPLMYQRIIEPLVEML